MLQMMGTPTTRFRAIGLNCCRVLLAWALLLTATSPVSLSVPRSQSANHLIAPERLHDTAGLPPVSHAPSGKPSQRATIDLAGWQFHAQRFAPDLSGFALIQAPDLLSDIAGGTSKPWPVIAAAAPLAALVAYSAHAPPA